MKPAISSTQRRREAGYTLLMVVFLVATMSIAAMAVAPNLLTQGRREKEAEMIWRGQQYQRAIGLYFRKFGKYPTKIEDLTKQTNGVRFLRQAYPDPMNKDDGSWRFIYVANGQLIGSLRPASLLQTALSSQGIPGLSVLTGGGQSSLGTPGTGTNQQQGAGSAIQGLQANSANSANPLESQPQPLMGAALGGNIIGVGSKIKKPSLKVYMGGDTYQEWEFIANINGQQTGLPVQAPVNPNPNFTPGTNPNPVPNGPGSNSPNPNAPGGQ
jgi:type II secretory pathway pseudopilin PulG